MKSTEINVNTNNNKTLLQRVLLTYVCSLVIIIYKVASLK